MPESENKIMLYTRENIDSWAHLIVGLFLAVLSVVFNSWVVAFSQNKNLVGSLHCNSIYWPGSLTIVHDNKPVNTFFRTPASAATG